MPVLKWDRCVKNVCQFDIKKEIYTPPPPPTSKKRIKNAKGHEDQDNLHGRIFSFSQLIIWDFCYFRIINPMRSQIKGAESPRYGRQWWLLGIFLGHKGTGVSWRLFASHGTADRRGDSTTRGNSLWLAGAISQPSSASLKPSVFLYLEPTWLIRCFCFVLVAVIPDCPYEAAPCCQRTWVISGDVRVMTPCFSPLSGVTAG